MTTGSAQDRLTLEQLQDRAEIADLLAELTDWLDEKRWEDAAAIFTEDATADTPGGVTEGRENVVAQASRNHEDRTQHLLANVAIALDGDTAKVRAGLFLAIAEPAPDGDGETLLLMGGTYRLGLRRTADGWRIASLQVRPRWRREV